MSGLCSEKSASYTLSALEMPALLSPGFHWFGFFFFSVVVVVAVAVVAAGRLCADGLRGAMFFARTSTRSPAMIETPQTGSLGPSRSPAVGILHCVMSTTISGA